MEMDVKKLAEKIAAQVNDTLVTTINDLEGLHPAQRPDMYVEVVSRMVRQRKAELLNEQAFHLKEAERIAGDLQGLDALIGGGEKKAVPAGDGGLNEELPVDGLREYEIPELYRNEVIVVHNPDHVSIFYGIDHMGYIDEAMEAVERESKKYCEYSPDFLTDFKKRTVLGSRTWRVVGANMIFENTDADDKTRLLKNGEGSYECIVWRLLKNKGK